MTKYSINTLESILNEKVVKKNFQKNQMFYFEASI